MQGAHRPLRGPSPKVAGDGGRSEASSVTTQRLSQQRLLCPSLLHRLARLSAHVSKAGSHPLSHHPISSVARSGEPISGEGVGGRCLCPGHRRLLRGVASSPQLRLPPQRKRSDWQEWRQLWLGRVRVCRGDTAGAGGFSTRRRGVGPGNPLSLRPTARTQGLQTQSVPARRLPRGGSSP